jgi:hypothetical protein
MRFRIYRYNPYVDAKPQMKSYNVAMEPTDRMLLDGLMRIKEADDRSISPASSSANQRSMAEFRLSPKAQRDLDEIFGCTVAQWN